MYKKLASIGFLGLLVILSLGIRQPHIQDVGMLDYYEYVSKKYEELLVIRETGEGLTKEEYKEIYQELDAFDLRIDVESQLRFSITRAYRLQDELSSLDPNSRKYEDVNSKILDEIDSIKIRLRDYKVLYL